MASLNIGVIIAYESNTVHEMADFLTPIYCRPIKKQWLMWCWSAAATTQQRNMQCTALRAWCSLALWWAGEDWFLCSTWAESLCHKSSCCSTDSCGTLQAVLVGLHKKELLWLHPAAKLGGRWEEMRDECPRKAVSCRVLKPSNSEW